MLSKDLCKGLLFAVVVIQIYSVDLPHKTYRCKNGEYVRNTSVCEDTEECTDRSNYEFSKCHMFVHHGKPKNFYDDYSDTDYPTDIVHCREGQFLCRNKTECIDANKNCDTKIDCPDGSDESECGDEVNVQNCSLHDGKFLCNDKLRCLGVEYACNGECNCFDCSDENDNCSKTDYRTLEECPHSYFPTPLGPQCFCHSNNKMSSSLCKEIKDCSSSHLCHQKCSWYKNRTLCSCYDDFVEIPGTNGFRCQDQLFYGNSLVYSTSTQIKSVNLTSRQITVVKDHVQCASVAAAKDEIYYTTFSDDRKTIFKVSTVFKITSTIIMSNTSITSIATDYVTNNIYYTTNTSLWVCNNNGRICIHLKCCDIRGITLVPKLGLMIYTKKSDYQDERFVMKANMDGSNEEFLVDGTYRGDILMAIDESIQKFYWLVKDDYEINSLTLLNPSSEIQSISVRGVPVSLTALDSKLFQTRSRNNVIYVQQFDEFFTKRSSRRGLYYEERIRYYDDSENSNNININDDNLTVAVRYIHAYNPLQQFKMKNPCEKASCSGLCVLGSISSKNNLNYTCITRNVTSDVTQNGKIFTQAKAYTQTTTQKISLEVSDALKQETPSHHPVLMGLLVMGLLAIALGGIYFAYSKSNWFHYYITMLKWRTTKNERRGDICEQEGL